MEPCKPDHACCCNACTHIAPRAAAVDCHNSIPARSAPACAVHASRAARHACVSARRRNPRHRQRARHHPAPATPPHHPAAAHACTAACRAGSTIPATPAARCRTCAAAIPSRRSPLPATFTPSAPHELHSPPSPPTHLLRARHWVRLERLRAVTPPTCHPPPCTRRGHACPPAPCEGLQPHSARPQQQQRTLTAPLRPRRSPGRPCASERSRRPLGLQCVHIHACRT